MSDEFMSANPSTAATGARESGGKLVRDTWIAWAKEQPNPKPSWLVPWEQLSEPDREVDRRIWEACVAGAAPVSQTVEEIARGLGETFAREEGFTPNHPDWEAEVLCRSRPIEAAINEALASVQKQLETARREASQYLQERNAALLKLEPNPRVALASVPQTKEETWGKCLNCGVVRYVNRRGYCEVCQPGLEEPRAESGPRTGEGPMERAVDSNELLPCPFCGDEHVSVQEYDTKDAWWVVCDNIYCGAEGSAAKTQEAAINKWNTRAAPSVLELTVADNAVGASSPSPSASSSPETIEELANELALKTAHNPKTGEYFGSSVEDRNRRIIADALTKERERADKAEAEFREALKREAFWSGEGADERNDPLEQEYQALVQQPTLTNAETARVSELARWMAWRYDEDRRGLRLWIRRRPRLYRRS